MKKWLLLLGLAAVAAAVNFCFFRERPLPSRQIEHLDAARYRNECDFAVAAIRSFNTDIADFIRLWPDSGDLCQSAVRLLRKQPLKNPEVTGVFRYAANPRHILVTLCDPEVPAVVVTVFQSEKGLKLSDLVAAPEGVRR